jgi:hypothetical protein
MKNSALPPSFTIVPSLLGLGVVAYGLLAGTLGLGLAAISILILGAGLVLGIAQLISD